MQNERRKADDIMRRYRDNEKIERERNKKERDKEEKLAEWIRKKEEDMKGNGLEKWLSGTVLH